MAPQFDPGARVHGEGRPHAAALKIYPGDDAGTVLLRQRVPIDRALQIDRQTTAITGARGEPQSRRDLDAAPNACSIALILGYRELTACIEQRVRAILQEQPACDWQA